MTYLSLAFGIGLSLSVGFFLTDILLRQIRIETWLKAWLGIGVGLGISSLTYFTWRLVFRPEGPVYFLAELVFAVGLGFVAFSLRRRVKAVEVLGPPLGQARLPAVWSWLLNTSLVIATISAGLNYLFGTLISPHGTWDAWAIWNLAARFLYKGNSEWKNLFEPSIPHPDYPLLVPGNVARLWAYRGAVDFLAPTVIGCLFFLATLGLLLSLSALTRGRVSSRLAGLALFGSSTILITGPTKVADIPLGYYLLGALGCLSLYRKFTKPGFLIIAGIFIGLGAWTKNEGWLLAIAVLLGWALTGLLFERRRFFNLDRQRDTGWLFIGLIPIMIFPLFQKWYLSPPNDLVAGQGGETLVRISDPARWILIGQRFTDMFFSFMSQYSAPLGVLLVLTIIFGLREKALSQPEVWINLIALLVAMAGYFLVYLVTPHNLTWHLNSSLNRLFAQLWPAAVLTMILMIKLPGET